MNKLFLKDEYINILIKIFNSYCPNATILAYGSRIKGEAQEFSDLDLTVINFGDTNCNINELKNLINDSNIPILVDINYFENLPDYIKNEILKYNLKIYGK